MFTEWCLIITLFAAGGPLASLLYLTPSCEGVTKNESIALKSIHSSSAGFTIPLSIRTFF